MHVPVSVHPSNVTVTENARESAGDTLADTVWRLKYWRFPDSPSDGTILSRWKWMSPIGRQHTIDNSEVDTNEEA